MCNGKNATKYNFRDVSLGLQKLRDFLLGRKTIYHNRFPPLLSPRSIPPADIPRGPEERYAKQYYFRRAALNSVKPPVVAPIAEAPKKLPPKNLKFACPPTPGLPWGWDGHCYFETVHTIRRPPPPPPETCQPPPPERPPCATPEAVKEYTKSVYGVDCDPCRKPQK